MRIQVIIVLLFGILGCSANFFKDELWETNDVDLGNGGDSLFYYLFLARKPTNRFKKLVIWLSGGPGCSSTAGLLMENGPYVLNDIRNLTSSSPSEDWGFIKNN